MARDGQPRKYSKALHEQIVANVRKGQPKSLAFKVARVHPDTVFDWLRFGRNDPDQYPEYVNLADDIEQAQADSVAERLDQIAAAAKSDPKHWTANAWILERTMPEHFARRDRVEVEARRPLVQTNQVILIDADAREAAFALLERVTAHRQVVDAEVLELEAHLEDEE